MVLREVKITDVVDYNHLSKLLHKENYTDKPSAMKAIEDTSLADFKKLINNKALEFYLCEDKGEAYGYLIMRKNKDNSVIEQAYSKKSDRKELISKALNWCEHNKIHRVYARCKKWNKPYLEDLKNTGFITITQAGDWLFLTNYIK